MSGQIQCRQCGKALPRSDFPTGEFKCPDCNWTQLLSPSGRSRSRKKKKEKRAHAAAAVEPTAETRGPIITPIALPEVPDEAAEAVAEAPIDAAIERFDEPIDPPIDEPIDPPLDALVDPVVDADEPPPSGPALAPLSVLDIDGLRDLPSHDFTLWCLAVLARFGYVPSDEPPGDGPFELVRGHDRLMVDCIAFCERENVGRPEAQQLLHAMEREGISRGMLLTCGSFESGCRALAQRHETPRIDLIDGDRLEETARELAEGPLAWWWS